MSGSAKDSFYSSLRAPPSNAALVRGWRGAGRRPSARSRPPRGRSPALSGDGTQHHVQPGRGRRAGATKVANGNSRAADQVHAPPSRSSAIPTTSRTTPSASGIAPIHIGGASTISSPPRTTRTSATVRRADRFLIIVGFSFPISGKRLSLGPRSCLAWAGPAKHSTRIMQSALIVINGSVDAAACARSGGASDRGNTDSPLARINDERAVGTSFHARCQIATLAGQHRREPCGLVVAGAVDTKMP